MPGRSYVELDYSKLLNELKGNNKVDEPDPEKEAFAARIEEAKQNRKKLMKDPETRFVFSAKYRILHDKDCAYAAKIKDLDFRARSVFPGNLKKCDICYRRALIRAGLQPEDYKDINDYSAALYRIGMTEEELYELTVLRKARFCGVSSDRVRVKLNDDKWELLKNGDELQLLHNDYSIDSNYERSFNGDFHLQMSSLSRNGYTYIIECMTKYSWPRHVEALKAKEAARIAEREKNRMRKYLAGIANFKKLFRISLRYKYYIVLDCDGKLRELFGDGGVGGVLLAYEKTDGPFALSKIRVPRKQYQYFVDAMEKLKDYSIENEHYDYGDNCINRLSDIDKSLLTVL